MFFGLFFTGSQGCYFHRDTSAQMFSYAPNSPPLPPMSCNTVSLSQPLRPPVTCYFAVTSVRGLDHSRTCLLQDTSYITLLWCNEFCTYITGQGSVILTVVLHQVSNST